MRVDFSSDYFGATLAAPKARSAKLGSALGLDQLLLSPFRRARVAPNGSSFLSRFPEKVVHPDFKIPGNARRCCLILASRVVRGEPGPPPATQRSRWTRSARWVAWRVAGEAP